jgi:hypothetical protein
MKYGHQNDVLKTLQAQLEHFNQSPDFGDAEAVAVIRQHLLLRIREAESAMRCREWLLPRAVAA